MDMTRSSHYSGLPTYRVDWRVSPTYEVLITSSFVCGLHELQRSGEIVLKISSQKSRDTLEHIMLLSVKDVKTGESRAIGFDYFDRSDIFCLDTLESVDVYFKRSCWQPDTETLPDHLKPKIMPSGLTFACRTKNSERLFAKAVLMAFMNRLRQRNQFKLQPSILRLRHDLLEIIGFLRISEWEKAEADNAKKRIVFQTRVWPKEPNVDRTVINASRINLVRKLRREFGSKESIGLLDMVISRELAPDAILSEKVSRARYARQLRTSIVAVNSYGLDGSAGLKVGESLAAGCAIVSEPFRVELPVPLVPEVNYLPFKTADECVSRCRYLLENEEVADRMRAANLNYYRENVRPAAMARNLLHRAFSFAGAGGY